MKRVVQPIRKSALITMFESVGVEKLLNNRKMITPAFDEEKRVYMVTRGSLTVSAVSGTNEANIRFIKPYEIFGVDGLFDRQAPSVTTLSYRPRYEAHVSSVSHSEIRKWGTSCPIIYSDLAEQINKQLVDASNRLMEVMFDDLVTSIYKALKQLAGLADAMTHPDGIQIKVTRIELALMTGCSRESAGRAIKTLREKGLISAIGSMIVVFREPHAAPAISQELEQRNVS